MNVTLKYLWSISRSSMYHLNMTSIYLVSICIDVSVLMENYALFDATIRFTQFREEYMNL